MQECQPLGVHLQDEKIDAGRVAARPREAGNKTKLDRVGTDCKYDRNCRGGSFGRDRTGRVDGRGDHRNATAD